jgi:CheY-like chemotaxis protein
MDANQPPLPGILLIDDDAISREVMSMMLEIHGFSVQAAEDGAAALTILEQSADSQSTSPGLILMDTQMPGLNGLELISALRSHSTARLIAISGSEVNQEIHDATDGFLLKPVEPEALVALLRQTPAHSASPVTQANAEADRSEENENAIDPAILSKLKAMMPAAAVREIYTAVAADLKTRLPKLQSAMDSGEVAEVQRIGHAIKGGCAMVGLTQATEAATALESSNLPVTWPDQLQQLHFALCTLEGILGDEFPR